MWRCSSKTMNKDAHFSIWAPDDSPWSPWAKPVLFAYLDAAPPQSAVTEVVQDLSWCPSPAERAALVLDLPGPEGVLVALSLPGYRPVPLYNAVPLPFGEPQTDVLTGKAVAAVNVLPIICALRDSTEALTQMKLP